MANVIKANNTKQAIELIDGIKKNNRFALVKANTEREQVELKGKSFCIRYEDALIDKNEPIYLTVY